MICAEWREAMSSTSALRRFSAFKSKRGDLAERGGETNTKMSHFVDGYYTKMSQFWRRSRGRGRFSGRCAAEVAAAPPKWEKG